MSGGKVKVSVIVPVYNAERYLRQCLDSIVNQTLREIEIICVDDGSTDDSLEVLKEYQAVDGRISVLRQQNQYAGVARNAGMAVAQGDYLVFWDSDDYFDETALEKMHSKIEADQADICVCGGKRYYEREGIEVVVKDYLNPSRIPDAIPFNRHTNPDYIINFTCEAPWNKMFRKSFIERERLEFQSRRNGNDVFFVACALCLANRVTIVKEPLVCYRKNRVDSTVGTLSKAPYDPLLSWIDVRKTLLLRGAFPEISFENKALGVVVYCLNNLQTWEAYDLWHDFLKNDGLADLGIQLRNRDFYQLPWRYDFLSNLQTMSKEDFFAYFAHWNYLQSGLSSARYMKKAQELSAANKDLRSAQARVCQLESSRSYKVGRILTAPVRLLRRVTRS